MSAEMIGLISGLLVIISAIPYSIRTYQGKIHPNLTSWSLWMLIGLALLLTYKSSGAEANVWPAVFGFISPFFITILNLATARWMDKTKPNRDCLSRVWSVVSRPVVGSSRKQGVVPICALSGDYC